MSRLLFLLSAWVLLCGVSPSMITISHRGRAGVPADPARGISPHADLILGTLGPDDGQAVDIDFSAAAEPGVVYEQSIRFGVINITYVSCTEVGASQNANVFVLSGGVGTDQIILNFVSEVGRGLHYYIAIFGAPDPDETTDRTLL